MRGIGFLFILIFSLQAFAENTYKYIFANGSALLFRPEVNKVEYFPKDGEENRMILVQGDISRFYNNTKNSGGPAALFIEHSGSNTSFSDKYFYQVAFDYKEQSFTILEANDMLLVATEMGVVKEIDPSQINVENFVFSKAEEKYHEWKYKVIEHNIILLELYGVNSKTGERSTHYFLVNGNEAESLGVYDASVYVDFEVDLDHFEVITLDGNGDAISTRSIKNMIDHATQPQPQNLQVTPAISNSRSLTLFNSDTPVEKSRENFLGSQVKATNENGEQESVEAIVHRVFKDYEVSQIKEAKAIFPSNEALDQQIREGLTSDQSRTVVVLGESGSGKSEAVRSFVKNVKDGKYPEIPKWTKFIEVNINDIEAGTSLRGQVEARMKALMLYARNHDVILVIDEFDTFRGGGSTSGDRSDILNKIESYLGDGSLQVIGISKPDKFYRAFGSDDGLIRKFTIAKKDPFPKEMISQALLDWSAARQKVPLAESLRERIVFLSKEYDAFSAPLNKAVRLQDRFYAHLKIKELDPQKATIEMLDTFAATLYHLDVRTFSLKGRQEIYSQYQTQINKNVKGAEKAKRTLDFMAKKFVTNMAVGSDTPQGRVLFVGPAGVGKTYIPKMYAQAMGFNYKRLILSHYLGKPAEDFLIDIGNELEKDIFTVFLLDEVEKAPKHIQDIVLGIMDSGAVSVPKPIPGSRGGERKTIDIMTSKSTFFMGSNAGAAAIVKNPNITGQELKEAIMGDENPLSEYLIDRMVSVITFGPPQTREAFIDVVKMAYLAKLEEASRSNGVKFKPTNETQFFEEMADKYFSPTQGFRLGKDQTLLALDNAIQEKIFSSKLKPGKTCKIVLQDIVLSDLSEPSKKTKVEMGFTSHH